MGVRRQCLACALAATWAALLLPGLAQARQSVLIVFDEDKDRPGLAAVNRNLRQVFRAELQAEVELYSESLQLSQFEQPGYDGLLREHFRRKYEGTRLDLIVAVMEPSLDFLLPPGEALFPGVPIVFCGLDPSDLRGKALPGNVTGVVVERNFAPTIETALRMQPGTREVFVVGGTARFDRLLQRIARRDLRPFAGRVRVTWLDALPMDALLRKVADLPPHSVILYLTLFADGAGAAFVPHDALSRISGAANAPVYVAVDQFVGLGAVGGQVYSVSTHGQAAARLGLRILRGAAASSLPVVATTVHTSLFDGRQLERWGLDERLLPPGSVVRFRAPSTWDLYKWYILGGVALFLLQTSLVVGLVVNRARYRRSQTARQESEQGRRRAEDEVQRQRDELAHALRVATLGELTVSLTHELSQPLTAVIANAQAARMLIAAEQPSPEVQEALDDVATEATRAAEIMRRLRALFRKQPAACAPLDMNAVIDDVLRLLAADLRNRQIHVHFARGERLPAVLGDSVQLRQVLINLLVNAEEAISLAGDGPREIRIATSRPDPGCVAIAIRDSGVGLDAADLERIFEHFVSSKPHGLGMGLAISRSIVEAQRGRIWATQNDGPGITLHVELPVCPPSQRFQQAQAASG